MNQVMEVKLYSKGHRRHRRMLNQQMSIIERPLRWPLPPEALRTDPQGPSGQKFLRHTLGGSHPTTMRRLRLCSQIAEMTQPPDNEAAR